jgi:DNA repair protein RadA/Sms
MLLAVLEARCGLNFSAAEVYLNVAGGYRLTDPAADLAVAAALVSALADRPLPAQAAGSAKYRWRARSGPWRTAPSGSRKPRNWAFPAPMALMAASRRWPASAMRRYGCCQIVDRIVGGS